MIVREKIIAIVFCFIIIALPLVSITKIVLGKDGQNSDVTVQAPPSGEEEVDYEISYIAKFKEKIEYSENKHIQFVNVKNYWNIAMRAKQISWIEKCRGISLKYSLLFWYNRLTKKNN